MNSLKEGPFQRGSEIKEVKDAILLAVKKQTAMLCAAYGEGWPLGTEGRNPTITKYSANNLNELGREPELQQRLKPQLTPRFQPVKP